MLLDGNPDLHKGINNTQIVNIWVKYYFSHFKFH